MEGTVLGLSSPRSVYAFWNGLPGLDRHLEIVFSETKTKIFQLPTKCPTSQNKLVLSFTFRVGQSL